MPFILIHLMFKINQINVLNLLSHSLNYIKRTKIVTQPKHREIFRHSL